MNVRPIAIASIIITLIVCITLYNMNRPAPTDPLAQQLRECDHFELKMQVTKLYYENLNKPIEKEANK